LDTARPGHLSPLKLPQQQRPLGEIFDVEFGETLHPSKGGEGLQGK
jgi:hypothetical protein